MSLNRGDELRGRRWHIPDLDLADRPDGPPATASRVPSGENARARTRSAWPFSAAVHLRSASAIRCTDLYVPTAIRARQRVERDRRDGARCRHGGLDVGDLDLSAAPLRGPSAASGPGAPSSIQRRINSTCARGQRILFVGHPGLELALDHLHQPARRRSRPERARCHARRPRRACRSSPSAVRPSASSSLWQCSQLSRRIARTWLKDTPADARCAPARAAHARRTPPPGARPDALRLRRPPARARRHAHRRSMLSG